MTPGETQLYNGNVPLTPKARVAFPKSEDELEHAGSCLAFGEPNASVYHSMIALEAPLRAQAIYFGVRFDGKTWGNAINNIEKKIAIIMHTRNPKRRTKDTLEFHSEASMQFRYFKDAWRNHIMHEGKDFGIGSATDVYDHVIAFVNHLSKRFSSRTRKRYAW
jgi:hypothetical protein